MNNMPNLVDYPQASGLIKISGKITGFRCRREVASFVLTPQDQSTLGIVAVAAAFEGLSGQAISTAGNAGSLDEEADHVSFSIGGQSIQGWVWRSPFKEGDFVEVVAEWQGNHFEAFGIARPLDRTIALYPHCSRGRSRHIRNALKWWLWLGLLTPSIALSALLLFVADSEIFADIGFYITLGITVGFFALMFTSLARKWLPFVSVAEKVFRTLGWPDPGNVDLVQSSKIQRTATDQDELGIFYFRY